MAWASPPVYFGPWSRRASGSIARVPLVRFTLYDAQPIGAFASVGDVYIVVLRRPSTLEALAALRRGASEHRRSWKGPTRSITVIEPQSMQLFVSEPIRKESAQLTIDFPATATAIVVEGEGFGTAAMRSFVAGIYLLAGKSSNHRITATVAEAATWLARATKEGASEADIVAAIDEARRRIPG
jgi:hypothetical protein